jgi:hypothetical protein
MEEWTEDLQPAPSQLASRGEIKNRPLLLCSSPLFNWRMLQESRATKGWPDEFVKISPKTFGQIHFFVKTETCFVSLGWSYPLGLKLSVRPHSPLNSWECSPLGVNEGVNIPPGGQFHPSGWRVKLRKALWSHWSKKSFSIPRRREAQALPSAVGPPGPGRDAAQVPPRRRLSRLHLRVGESRHEASRPFVSFLKLPRGANSTYDLEFVKNHSATNSMARFRINNIFSQM